MKMLYQVIGVGRKVGEFTPKDKPDQEIHYDNIVFHVVGLKKSLGVTGQIAEQLSIKTVDAGEIVEAVGGKIEQAVGRQFDFETRYGNKIRTWELVK